MKRLQAVTVCVNYVDMLQCVLPNREHFDRWIIVTSEADRETINFCKENGLHWICSKRIYENNATFHKAKALNDGLDEAGQGWVAVIDADIYLPSDFRARMDAQTLDWRSVYGLKGRRVCESYAEFERMRFQEPWLSLWYSTTILGYFNLIHLSQPNSRYPETVSEDASGYDMAYADNLPASKRKKLPFPCLHLGPVKENWRGRKSKRFIPRSRRVAERESKSRILEALRRYDAVDLKCRTALLLGYEKRETSEWLAQHFGRVLLLDEWGINAETLTESEAADKRVLAERFRSVVEDYENVEMIGGYQREVIDQIDRESIDLIVIGGEPTFERLMNVWSDLRSKLKVDGSLIGSGFGLPYFRESSQAISLLLGVPGNVYGDGSWALKRDSLKGGYLAKYLRCEERVESFPSGQQGVIICVSDDSAVEPAILTLSSLRLHWDGPVAIVHFGEPIAELKFVCFQLAAAYFNRASFSRSASVDEVRALGLLSSPFEESLFVQPGTIAVGDLRPLMKEMKSAELVTISRLEEPAPREKATRYIQLARTLPELSAKELAASWVRGGAICPHIVGVRRRTDEVGLEPLEMIYQLTRECSAKNLKRGFEVALSLVSERIGGRVLSGQRYLGSFRERVKDNGKVFLVPEGDGKWDEFSRRSDCVREVQSFWIRANASDVRVGSDITVVSVAIAENLEQIRRNGLTWRFADNVECTVIAANLDDKCYQGFELPGVSIQRWAGKDLGDAESRASLALLEAIPDAIETDFVVFINSGCFPLPGAELFLSDRWKKYGVVGCGRRNLRCKNGKNLELASILSPLERFFYVDLITGVGMLETQLVKEAKDLVKARKVELPVFDRIIGGVCQLSGRRIGSANVVDWGWVGIEK